MCGRLRIRAQTSICQRPMQSDFLIQQFEDVIGGVAYIETHEPDRYAGHFRLRLVEFAPTRVLFDIERATDPRIEVTFTLNPQQFQEVEPRRSRHLR